MTRIRVETGTGYRLIICSCGWREMVHTESALQTAAQTHKSLVHGDTVGGSGYAAKRRQRYAD